ncbi:MAG: protein-L-isoaspartate O-methyltransferase family protein [Candidatus Poseidoniaceae archaeon]
MEEMRQLLDRISESGIEVPQLVRDAMCELHLGQFTTYDFDGFFHDRPVVFMETENGGVKTISAPHMIVTLLHHLELKRGQEVLVVGSKGGYLAALIATIVGEEGKVIVIDPSEEIVRHTANALAGWPTIDLRHVESIDVAPIELPGELSRVLITGSIPSVPKWMEDRIVEGGFVIAPIGDHHHQELMKNECQFNALHPTSLGPVSFGPVDIIESEPQPLTALEIADLIETLIETCHEMELCGAEELQQLGAIADELRTMMDAEEGELEDFITAHMQHFVQLWPMIQLMFAPTLARPGDVNQDDNSGFHFDEFKP